MLITLNILYEVVILHALQVNMTRILLKYIFLYQCYERIHYLFLALMYSRSNKKRNTPIYFNTNYRREMKLVPIIMDYCLL